MWNYFGVGEYGGEIGGDFCFLSESIGVRIVDNCMDIGL